MIKFRSGIGWLAYGLSLLATCFWAFWGILENFHEGWYFPDLGRNLQLMMIQYLSPMFLFGGLTLISIRFPRVGAGCFLLVGAFLMFKLSNYILPIPMLLLALLYFFGSPDNKKWKYRLLGMLPLLTLLILGTEPAWRVSGRLNDGNWAARRISGNGVDLIWAPRGPGWPDQGVNWYTADSICRYLEEDGTSLADQAQNIWRLPTVEEAVRSMHRGGENSQGYLDAQGAPVYVRNPDKETPLWNPHTPIIYWWTQTETSDQLAYIIVYDGKIWERTKGFRANYLGFRAVKKVP